MFGEFFANPGFMPHIHCYLGQPALVWTMMLTDFLIGLAYISISLTLWVLVRRIKMTFNKVILCFGLFIGACGGTHFMEVWTLWHPDYWVAAVIKAITATASIGTGIYLFKLRSPIVALAATARTAQLRGEMLEKQALDLVSVNQTLQQEIMERMDIEAELRRSEELFRITLDGVKDYAVFMLSPAGRIVTWNEGARRIKQYSKGEVIGQHFSIFYPEEDVRAGKPERELREAITTGRIEDEGWRVRKDGTRFWANVVITAIPDPNTGELRGFSKVTRDVTERMRAAQELRFANETLEKRVEERTAALKESENSFKYLADAMPQLVWMTHSDGHIYWYNQRWYDYTGTTREEMQHSGWERFHHPLELPRVVSAWRKAIEAKMSFEETFPLRSASGEFRWFLTRIVPIKNEKGDVIRWIGTNTDVHELREARETAQNAARLKSRFLDIAAHELRTPVTAFSLLLQFAQMQLEEKGRPVDASLLARLRAQADRISRLVVDLLDVSQLERGALKLKREPTDIASLISECLITFKLQSPSRHFIFSKPEQPIKANIDPLRIYQVISNLIDNAVKYTLDSIPIKITVDATSSQVRVSIKDQGAGMSEFQQATLFTAFARGATDQEERTSGLGLGLFISKSIINLHGGTIHVISKPEEGTTFAFELPREVESK